MYRVDIKNSGSSVFNVKSSTAEFIIDTQGKGVNPPEALLASLGSCIGVYIRKYMEGASVDLKEFSITVEAEFSKDRPVRFSNIKLTIDFKGTKLEEFRRRTLIDFIMNCPVHSTLKNNPSIEFNII